jgi:glycosyltransferase involved in cell wall biosynthesis
MVFGRARIHPHVCDELVGAESDPKRLFLQGLRNRILPRASPVAAFDTIRWRGIHLSTRPVARAATPSTEHALSSGAVRRVLMLNYEFPPIGGGSGNATSHLLREFARAGDLDIDLVTSSEGGFRIEPFSERIRLHRLPVGKKDLLYWRTVELIRYSWRAYRYAERLLAQGRYDVCHCWSGWPPGVIGHLLERRVPYVVSLRGSDVPGYSRRLRRLDGIVFKPLSRRVWSRSSALVANSSDLRTLALRTHQHPIDVIPNGVDTEKFAPSDSGTTPVAADSPLRLLYVGRFVERKNVPLLLRAMTRVSGCTLTLVGDGKCAAEWRDLVRTLGLGERVHFAGHVPHDRLGRHYRAADVFVLPSDREGMSNSLLEALASGLAIVSTDTGGASELVGSSGLVVPTGEVEPLAAALESLVRDPALVQRMKAEARRRAGTLTWRSVSERYREVYQRAVGQASRRG